MTSETMDSSSFFSKELSFHDERQLGFWKTEGMNKLYEAKADGSLSPYISSPHERVQGNSLIPNGFEHSDFYSNRDHRANALLDTFGPSAGAENHEEEKESFESLKELEAKTIGNLLPDDDDDLFYSVADVIDTKKLNTYLGEQNSITDGNHPVSEYQSRTLFVRNINSSIQDSELRTLFGKYGDICSLYTTCKSRGFVMITYYDIRAACNAMKSLQNKTLQHRKLDIHFSLPKDTPSEKDVNQATLVVFNIDSSVSNDELRQIFGVYGEVKEIREGPHRSHRKFIEFYDVRAADAALCGLNRSDIAGNKIELEPSVPYGYSGSISCGGIISNTGNGTVPSARSSGRPPVSPCWENAFTGPKRSPCLPNLELPNNQSNSFEGSNPHGQLNFNIWGTPDFQSDCLADSQDIFASGVTCKSPGNMTFGRVARPSELQEKSFGRVSPREPPFEWNDNVFSASPNGNGLSPGQHYLWSNTSPRTQGNMWSNSPAVVSRACSPRPQQMHAISRPPSPASHLPSGLVQMNNHPMVSPRSVNPSLWERRNGYTAEPPETSTFNSGSLGGLSIPGNLPQVTELVPNNLFPCSGGSPMDSVHSPNVQLHPQNQRFMLTPTRGPLSPVLSPFQSPNERTRGRRNDGSLNQGDNKHFELDIDRIMQGEDKRTTLMIKNIPNKYTSKMLLVSEFKLDE